MKNLAFENYPPDVYSSPPVSRRVISHVKRRVAY